MNASTGQPPLNGQALDRVWFVGCGNMAGAMIEGWCSAGANLGGAVVIRPSGRPVEGLRVVTDVAQAGSEPWLVFLGFKPQQLDEVAPGLAGYLTQATTVVSMLAGVETTVLRQRFPNAGAIVRVLPNLPVSVRRGVVGVYSGDAPQHVRDHLSNLFAMLGYGIWTNTEAQLAAIGSLAGAGPAYVARFIDALAKAGVDRGLSFETASTIALETVLGTAWMAASTRESMDSIAERVASPKGTTEAGLAVLDREDVLDKIVSLAISAASRRAAEIASEARPPKLAESPPLP
jgi:pyrroline-5-carboxylate reductase